MMLGGDALAIAASYWVLASKQLASGSRPPS